MAPPTIDITILPSFTTITTTNLTPSHAATLFLNDLYAITPRSSHAIFSRLFATSARLLLADPHQLTPELLRNRQMENIESVMGVITDMCNATDGDEKYRREFVGELERGAERGVGRHDGRTQGRTVLGEIDGNVRRVQVGNVAF